jgi:NAD(P)-dependent dehydrogenase (short-subunit alcohol dehydrogenase family)
MSGSDTFPNISFDYSGYRVLVTGGSNGIGEGIARAYLAAGADVTITGTRACASDYDKDLSACNYLQMIATDKGSIQAVAESLPTLDILINNAGASLPDGKDEYEPDIFEKAITINLTSNYRLAAALKDKLSASALPGGASIVGMASMSSLFGIEIVPGYGSAKTGLMGLTRVLGVNYARSNIRVNAIACGFIESNMTRAMLDIPELIQPHLDRTPLGRRGQPQDIAGPTLFLTSPAAAYITGQTLVVDGGYSVQG